MTKRSCECRSISIIEDEFGEISAERRKSSADDRNESLATLSYGEGEGEGEGDGPHVEPVKIKSYTMCNSNRMEVMIITWGATIVSIKCPDKYGEPADVVLGFDDLDSYLDPTLNQFMGCVLGRCANRIRDATFILKGQDYFLTKNEKDRHHLHGGTNGFGRRVWEAHVDDCQVVMSYLSEDGEEGYPGAVLATLKFKLTDDNRLEINMRATTSKPTVVNLSHGSLFNLAGHDAGEEELKAHKVSINADRWAFAEFKDPIPTGAVRAVGGTIMDLRIPRRLGDIIENVPPGEGYDHNYGVIRSSQPEVSFVSRAFHPKSGRFLEVYSDQPGVQFYTGGRLPPYSLISEPDSDYECGQICDCPSLGSSSQISVKSALDFLPGKCGAQYKRFGAFSIQPQNYPNAVNIPHFPCAILRPGQVYYHDLVYKFGIQLSGYM